LKLCFGKFHNTHMATCDVPVCMICSPFGFNSSQARHSMAWEV
jgi:hypothetical protein